MIVFPIEHDGSHIVNFVGFCYSPEKEGTVYPGKTVEKVSEEELLDQFKGWEEETQQLLKVRHSEFVKNRLILISIFAVH